MKFSRQHLTRKTPLAKAVASFSNNGQKGEKQLEDRETSQDSQLIEPRKVNASLTKGSQVDMGTTPDLPSLNTKTRIERRSYALVAISKPAKSPEQPWT